MDGNFSRNTMLHLTNGIIEELDSNRNNTLITVSYTDCVNCNRREYTIRLVVGNNTAIFDENGRRIRPRDLMTGMVINATYSSAMTRSIPPQATAYLIRIIRESRSDRPPVREDMTTGRIWNVNRNDRSFDTITGQDFSTLTRFNVSEDARILNRMGRPISFSELMIGMRVRVTHANFMTASIPPQTTAFEVQIL